MSEHCRRWLTRSPFAQFMLLELACSSQRLPIQEALAYRRRHAGGPLPLMRLLAAIWLRIGSRQASRGRSNEQAGQAAVDGPWRSAAADLLRARAQSWRRDRGALCEVGVSRARQPAPGCKCAANRLCFHFLLALALPSSACRAGLSRPGRARSLLLCNQLIGETGRQRPKTTGQVHQRTSAKMVVPTRKRGLFVS